MTSPQRRAMLNAHIDSEARRIAHTWTTTCKGDPLTHDLPPDDDEWHTNRCNALKAEIVQLAMNVKLARLQPPAEREPAPDFALTGSPADA